jgi:predicted nucleotide-binding protein
MAKRKPKGDQGEPELLVSRWDALNLITERIKIGKEFLNSRIPSMTILDDERKKYYNWSKYNDQLLTKIFSNNSIAEEYTYWAGIMVSGGQTSLQEEITEHFDDIREKIGRLESIIERLELFDEANTVTKKDIENTTMQADNKKVFIIHGHDETRLLELEKMLKDDFKLTPIILKDQPDGGASTIIEKFELYAPQCIYAIALFTPDDQVENGGKSYLQARPNVIYELGWFSAKLSRKNVMLVLKDGTDIFTDFQGIIQKRFRTQVVELYRDLHIELKAAGLVT